MRREPSKQCLTPSLLSNSDHGFDRTSWLKLHGVKFSSSPLMNEVLRKEILENGIRESPQ